MKVHMPLKRRQMSGFSLVEMMVAITVGLVLLTVMSVVYINSKSAAKRQDDLGTIQQGVRTAFEYVAFDARSVGHLGCFTRLPSLNGISGAGLANNFAIGIEGYEFTGTAPTNTYEMSSDLEQESSVESTWANSPGATSPTIPLAEIAGGAGLGLTPGSDVLILRGTATGKPVRLTAPIVGGAGSISITDQSTGNCPNGSANTSGFCAGSFGVIASCNAAQVFQVATSGATLTLQNTLVGTSNYAQDASEVFPLHTVVYYVKPSSNGTTSSLYRRVFDGSQTDVELQEHELIEGVESMQLRFALDTDAEPDGLMNGDYVTADAVTNWAQVIAVRVSLLVRSTNAVDASMAPASAPMNGMSMVFPTTGPQFDRRVFTTTVALRNRIAYAAP